MKKKKLLSLLAIPFILTGCSKNNEQNMSNNSSEIQINRTSSNLENSSANDITNPAQNPNTDQSLTENNNQENQASESTAYEFSTQIKTKSKNRLNNIQLTCNKINEHIVNPGEEFSFCQTTGKSTESDGYKKADVIIGKKIVQALGGGNCQVSTTLYNAVLGVPELEVTERHPHGKKINYVPEGKDAAIAHGSKDFKFKNNSDKKIKIYANVENNTVKIKLTFIS